MLHPTATKFLNGGYATIDGQPLLENDSHTQAPIMGRACMSFLNQFLQEITSELKSYECCPSNPMIENFNRFVETMNQYPFLVYILEHGAEHIIEKKHSYADEFQHLLKMMNQSGIRFYSGTGVSDWQNASASVKNPWPWPTRQPTKCLKHSRTAFCTVQQPKVCVRQWTSQ